MRARNDQSMLRIGTKYLRVSLLLLCLLQCAPANATDDSRIGWTFDTANPVIVPGKLNPSYDSKRTAGAYVVQLGEKYRMYYWATDAKNANHICVAESPIEHPNDWKELGAVLGPQPATDYNSKGPVPPCVVPRSDGPWLMYMGTIPLSPQPARISYSGLATSHDQGHTWKYVTREPLIAQDKPYDSVGTGTLCVIRDGGEFRMYYTAISSWEPRPPGCRSLPWRGAKIPIVGIGYATSIDGLKWKKPRGNFIVPPRRSKVTPYEHWIARPIVLKDEGGYRMWVSGYGTTYRVYSLTSPDGLHWSWVPSNPADGDLGIGKPGAFDDQMRCYAMVVKHGDEYRMWYTGNNNGATGMGYATGRVRKN